jgi:glycosyltransferase involved in cell wall biosynthesis
MQDARNLPDPNADLFVTHIDFKELNSRKTFGTGLKVLRRAIYSREAKDRFAVLLDRFQPDVVHLQSILYHITPSIIPVLKQHGIPVIQHLHDYSLICPDTHLLRDGRICEKCFGKRYYHCVLHRCKKGSSAASFLAATQRYLHEAIDILEHVSCFVAPSTFTMRKFVEAGFRYADRIECIPYFVDCAHISADWSFDTTHGVVFAGRLVAHKGVWTLLEAAAMVPEVTITILGDGELRSALEKKIAGQHLTNVDLRGWRSQNEVLETLRHARALVMPSECYETTGIAILEAGAIGRAAIVSNGTAMVEVMQDGTSSLVFQKGDSSALAMRLKQICSDVSLAERLGRRARTRVEQIYSAEAHYYQISRLYERVIEGGRRDKPSG